MFSNARFDTSHLASSIHSNNGDFVMASNESLKIVSNGIELAIGILRSKERINSTCMVYEVLFST